MKWNVVIVVTAIGVVGSLFGCTRGEPGSRADTSAAKDRNAAGRTERTVADAPPAVTSTGPACPRGGDLVFGCRIEGSDKAATLCATQVSQPVTTYRFGNAVRTELTLSDSHHEGSTTFHRTALTFAGATGGYVYSFRNAGTTYALYSISGNEGLVRAGIAVVDAAGKKQGELTCDPGSVQETESVELIRHTRTWTPDPMAASAVR